MKRLLLTVLFTGLATQSFSADLNYARGEKSRKIDIGYNDKICPDGIKNWQTLLSMNPYDTKDQCFTYSGLNVQLLNRTTALFGLLGDRQPFALIDFGKNSAPINYFSGVVKGKTAYVYQTVSGMLKTIHSFSIVNKSAEYEKKMAEKDFEEKQRAEIREQERIKDLKAKAALELRQQEQRKADELRKKEEAERLEKENKLSAERELAEDRARAIKFLSERGIQINANSVLDKKTGLVWKINVNVLTLKAAKNAVNEQFDGRSDWRIPSASELKTIFNYDIYSLSLAGVYVANPKDCFWTSETPSGGGDAHGICVYAKQDGTYGELAEKEMNVWFVRGGGFGGFVNGLIQNILQ